jgi:hypothetical protein
MDTDIDVEKLMKDCDRLSPEEKAKLVKRLLGDSSLNVIIGSSCSSHLTADTIYQINLSASDQIADILDAIASKIRSGMPTDRNS